MCIGTKYPNNKNSNELYKHRQHLLVKWETDKDKDLLFVSEKVGPLQSHWQNYWTKQNLHPPFLDNYQSKLSFQGHRMRIQGGAGVASVFSVPLEWCCLIAHAQN